jgi:hypothetical protein
MTNGVLLRDIPLTVRDVSSGGCLIESSAPLPIGTIGWLEVEFEGEHRFEWFRVARVQPCDGPVFVAGVEFLPLGAAGADSLRGAFGRLRRSARPRGSRGLARPSTHRDHEARGAVTRSGPNTTEPPATILNFSRRRS